MIGSILTKIQTIEVVGRLPFIDKFGELEHGSMKMPNNRHEDTVRLAGRKARRRDFIFDSGGEGVKKKKTS